MGTADHSTGAAPATARPANAERSFALDVFSALGDRLASRAADIELFTSTGCSYEQWCIWEAVSALHSHAGAPTGAGGEAGPADDTEHDPGDPDQRRPLATRSGGRWKAQPRLPYASVGVIGSRESADLLITDSARGERVLMELSVIHDWSRNEWIDKIDGDTEKLSRRMTPGVVRLQVILAASLDAPIDVNPVWQQWLSMSKVWNRPTDLRRVVPFASMGQFNLIGWLLPGP